MTTLVAKSFDRPDETRPFADRGRVDVVVLGDVTVGRGVLEPGWRWSEHVKTLAQTESCRASPVGYVLSGRMGVAMDDGTEAEAGPGVAFVIPPGHDAWVVGHEPCVFLDWSGMEEYARGAAQRED